MPSRLADILFQYRKLLRSLCVGSLLAPITLIGCDDMFFQQKECGAYAVSCLLKDSSRRFGDEHLVAQRFDQHGYWLDEIVPLDRCSDRLGPAPTVATSTNLVCPSQHSNRAQPCQWVANGSSAFMAPMPTGTFSE